VTAVVPNRDIPPVVSVLKSFDWQRFLVGWCAIFHAAVAITLAVAPWHQIYNAGTEPVFDLASRYVWVVLYAVAGLAAWSMLQTRYRPVLQMLTWVTVFPLGATWGVAFLLAVLQNQGSALSVIVWPALYVPWAIAAVRIGLGRR